VTPPESRLAAALADRYRIERELGAGGMATVYLAEDLKHHRRVAIKVLRADIAQALGAERFLREIEIAAGLTHPHILSVHDSGQADGFLYYVMPWVQGESLRQKLAREGALPVPQAARLLHEVADALAKAHRAGIVHRDVKPENVLLADGHALVTDFGVAKAVSEAGGEGTLTMAGMAVGTPTYMAPEQAAGDPHVDHRADLYAFGVVAYEMLTGRPPFTGVTPQQVLAAQVTTPPEPVTRYRAGLPAPLADLVMRCLAKHPADRPQTAEQLLPTLESAATPTGGTAALTGAALVRVQPPRRWWLLAGLGLAAVAFAVALYLGARGRPKTGGAGAGDIARSIAVLPFANLSGDSANEYFSDGISEEILNAVGQLPGVLVAARSSAFAFKGKNIPVGDVARQLQVAHVLEGSVQRAGNRVRITARLVDARSGSQRWSERYDRDATDIFGVEDEISRAIAGALRVELADKAAPGAAAEETADPQAHDLYLLGLHQMNQRTSAQDLETAAEYFARAVARDSGYARAFAGLGMAKVLLTEYADVPGPDLVPAGRAAVTRALALDSTLAPAHLAYAYLLKSYDWNWPAAEREYRTAIALDPNLATAHQWLNELLTDQRRLAEARVELGKALALDPASPVMRLDAGQYYRRAGHLDSAAAALHRATALSPRFAQAYMEGAMVAVAAGDYAEARDLVRQGAEAVGEPPAQFLTFLSGVERPATRPAAVRVVDQWIARGVFPIVVLARFYALLGEPARALTLLERAVEQRAPFTTYIGRWAELDRLAGEPRFQAIVRRIGLPPPAAKPK
jgi:eukaryotic-like serine/threonine-protein kinase